MPPASRDIYRGRIVWLRLEEVTLPNGLTIELEVVRHAGASAIVPLDESGQVTLIHQFRYAAGGYIWEIPAGILKPGEAPHACAARELREEVGLTAAELTPLGSVLTAPGFCDERIHLFLARQLSPAPQELDADEVLSVRSMPLAEALSMVQSGAIDDAKTIAGLTRAAARIAATDERR